MTKKILLWEERWRQAIAKWEVGQSYPDFDKIIILSDLFRISIDKKASTYPLVLLGLE